MNQAKIDTLLPAVSATNPSSPIHSPGRPAPSLSATLPSRPSAIPASAFAAFPALRASQMRLPGLQCLAHHHLGLAMEHRRLHPLILIAPRINLSGHVLCGGTLLFRRCTAAVPLAVHCTQALLTKVTLNDCHRASHHNQLLCCWATLNHLLRKSFPLLILFAVLSPCPLCSAPVVCRALPMAGALLPAPLLPLHPFSGLWAGPSRLDQHRCQPSSEPQRVGA